MDAVRKEMNIMRMLVHPHIIRLYELVETKERWYAVMEHAEVGVPCLVTSLQTLHACREDYGFIFRKEKGGGA
jgi:hypothetical protein